MIYLVCYLVSALFTYLASKQETKKRMLIYSAIAIMIPVILAGLRDYSIGIDTNGYLTKHRYWLGAASRDTLWEYLQYYFSLEYGEPLFAIFLGTVEAVFGNYSVFLFLIHLGIISGFYIGAFRMRKYVQPAVVMLVFYFVCFSQSLNIMRQYLAMAWVFAVFPDIHEKKWIRFFLVVAVAMTLHTSAFLALIPFFVYVVLNIPMQILNRKKWYRWGVVIGVTLAAVLLCAPVARLAMHLGILNEKYLFYLENEAISPAVLLSVITGAGLVAVYFCRQKIAARYAEFDFYFLNSIVYLLLQQFSWFIIYGSRLSMYQMFSWMITIAMVENVQDKPMKKRLAWVYVVGITFVYWLYIYCFRNASKTMPYRMIIGG